MALAIGCASVDAAAVAEPSRAATHSPETIKTILDDAFNRIDRLSVTYTARPLIGYQTEGEYVRRSMTTRRPADFFHMGAHGDARQPWTDDLGMQRLWLVGDRYDNEYVWRREAFHRPIRPTEGLPGTIPQDSWFECSAWWCLDREPPALFGGRAPVLPVVARTAAYDRVRSVLELVDGRWCHVLERSGDDALWVDVERPPGLMRRVVSEGEGGRVVARVDASNTEALGEGLWMPRRFRCRGYEIDPDATDPAVEYHLLVEHAALNEQADRVGAFVPPPGAITYPASHAERASQRRVTPGGLDHLDALTEWIARYHPPQAPPANGDFASICLAATVGGCAGSLAASLRWPTASCRRTDPDAHPN